jgi:hypothetical protein
MELKRRKWCSAEKLCCGVFEILRQDHGLNDAKNRRKNSKVEMRAVETPTQTPRQHAQKPEALRKTMRVVRFSPHHTQ